MLSFCRDLGPLYLWCFSCSKKVSVYLQYSFQVIDFVLDSIDRFPGREFAEKVIHVPVIIKNFKIATFSIVKFSGKLN